jgi:hypothetical protein
MARGSDFGFCCGGRYWTRTSDPRRVKAVLYQLSQSPRRAITVAPANQADSYFLAATVGVGFVAGFLADFFFAGFF